MDSPTRREMSTNCCDIFKVQDQVISQVMAVFQARGRESGEVHLEMIEKEKKFLSFIDFCKEWTKFKWLVR